MNQLWSRLALVLGLVTFSLSAQAEGEGPCASLPAVMDLILEQFTLGEFHDEEEFFKESRTVLYSKIDTCIETLKEDAETSMKKAKTDIFIEKAKAQKKMADGIESILNGAKLVCPHKISQGSPAQEFSCYNSVVRAVAEIFGN